MKKNSKTKPSVLQFIRLHRGKILFLKMGISVQCVFDNKHSKTFAWGTTPKKAFINMAKKYNEQLNLV